MINSDTDQHFIAQPLYVASAVDTNDDGVKGSWRHSERSTRGLLG